MNEQEILERGKKVRKFLGKQGGYWAFAPEEAMQIGPEPFVLDDRQVNEASRHGATIFEFWEQALAVLKASVAGDLPPWIAKSVEGPLSKLQQSWQRVICGERAPLPYLARMDCSSLWFPVEIQERLGFLGGCASWHQANNETGYPEKIELLGGGNIPYALACAFRRITGLRWPNVLLVSPKGYFSEQAFLRSALESHGILTQVIDRDELLAGVNLAVKGNRIIVNGQPIDLIYRRELNAATLAETQMGLSILESYLAGGVVIEPPLNMLYDCKSPMAWVHHPMTKEFFSEKVRNLIPLTVMLPLSNQEIFRLGDAEMTMNQVFGLSNEERRFVIKYAGPSIEYGFGGRAVYSLTGSHKQAGKIHDDARDKISKGHPWIMQIQDKEKFQVNWLDNDTLVKEPMYARLLFYYDRFDGLFAGHANFNKNWKVAGNKNTVFSVICEKRK